MNTFGRLDHYFKKAKSNKIQFKGLCHDCGKEVYIKVDQDGKELIIKGGAVYFPKNYDFFVKCDECYMKDPTLRDYQDCDVYSRVVGYLRPVGNWNAGKQAEWDKRVDYQPAE